MTFTASALVLAWVAIVLLALGLAGLLRQVSLLTRQLEHGGDRAAAAGGSGRRSARTTRELVGFRAPETVVDRVLHDGAHRTVVAFVSPGCSSCSLTLRALAAEESVAAGSVGLTLVSTGSCEPGLDDAQGAGRVACVPQGRDLMDLLAVPATPYLVALDPRGTLVSALLPDEDTDLAGWVRSTRGSLTITEERS
ncbi:hypothetical protein [Ornithinimicrobium flavum]|uniref:hypothetical protein n=1 Tax=Ornithinimicrobium flavum TaxID=1288636 RepID=UPI00106F66C7|nr:hypothetical protein [Ornithinimicrobium flavum]